jgi:hypothetical protein
MAPARTGFDRNFSKHCYFRRLCRIIDAPDGDEVRQHIDDIDFAPIRFDTSGTGKSRFTLRPKESRGTNIKLHVTIRCHT